MSRTPRVDQPLRRIHIRWIVIASVAVVFLTLALTTLARPATATPPLQEPVTPPSALNGKALFAENCAPCHGESGMGDGPSAAGLPNGAAALADPALASAATMQDWFTVTKEGRMDRMMPPWKERLNDGQIWDAVAYAYSLHVPETNLDRGAEVWAQQCSQCHGPLGAGDGPDAIANGWQMPDLTDPALAVSRSDDQWIQSVANGLGDMPAMAETVAEEDRLAAVQFARTFSYTPARTPALAEGPGALRGQVVNNTPGGGAPAGALVTLFPFEDFQERRALETSAGPDGAFAFEGLPTGSQFAYILSTEYGGLPFGSNVITFPTDTLQVDLTVPVWESTATPGEIRVNLAQLFVEPHQGNLLVGELYRLEHDGDRVYVGSEPAAPGRNAVLRFSLPAEATSLAVDGGEVGVRFIRTNDGVIDTQPLYPGSKQILMRYLLPYSGADARIEREMSYPVDSLSVLVADGPTVKTDLQPGDPQTIQEQLWNNFVATDLAAGQEISLRLSGLERASAASAAASAATGPALSTAVVAYHPPLLAAVALVTGLLVAALFVAYVVFKRPQPASAVATDAPSPQPVDERQSLLASIARLDDRFAAGELDEASYATLRKAEKRRLVQLSQRDGAAAVADPEQTDA